MRCEGCGAEALTTVRWRNGETRRKFALCEGCYTSLSGSVWIVRGPVAVFGTCRECGEWFSLRELTDVRLGGKWDSSTGVCPNCAKEE